MKPIDLGDVGFMFMIAIIELVEIIAIVVLFQRDKKKRRWDKFVNSIPAGWGMGR